MTARIKRLKGKKFVVAGLCLIVGVGAVAGYAYFSASGSGTATGAVGTSSTVTLHGAAASTLYPGVSSTVNFTVDNPASGHQIVGTIHLASVVACDTAFVAGACPSGHEITTCESINNGSGSNGGTNNFYMADIVANQDFPNGSGQAVTATGTLTMNNLASSQDTCKNASLLLNLTS
jgi:hypothetical protein